ncbi:cyclic-di-AMP-binding protein CbpB [uncultured Abiotrophia sp.]|uniref:cyclic-di-AMP-binding protein CbpB n=1 Tax=uncultured Abiotrophia sp. TaxID=316094 RepID=UPI00288902FB|nr:cyclic-di-AMP-binding protein CbpB [uncultured Abiotrophia sp.]
MIHPKIEALVASKMLDFMIPADNVANVIDQHTLSTGLLILTQSNYTMIPVLSAESKLMGVISMSMIIKAVMTVDAIEMERLDELKVRDVMLSQPVRVRANCHLADVLNYLIDQNFVCVVDGDNRFLGIITRKNVLQRLTHLLHLTSNPGEVARLIKLFETAKTGA